MATAKTKMVAPRAKDRKKNMKPGPIPILPSFRHCRLSRTRNGGALSGCGCIPSILTRELTVAEVSGPDGLALIFRHLRVRPRGEKESTRVQPTVQWPGLQLAQTRSRRQFQKVINQSTGTLVHGIANPCRNDGCVGQFFLTDKVRSLRTSRADIWSLQIGFLKLASKP